MALLITRGNQLGASNAAILAQVLWTTVELRAAFRAVPGPGEFSPVIVTGRSVWTPPSRCFLRGLTAQIDTGDPLVAAGGATTCSIGVQTTAADYVSPFVTAQTTAVWNTGRPFGWGRQGPAVTITNPGISEAGVTMFPANGLFPTEAGDPRTVAVGCDAGSYTGTLLIVFQYHIF